MMKLEHGNFQLNLDYFNVQEVVSEINSVINYQAKEKNILIKT